MFVTVAFLIKCVCDFFAAQGDVCKSVCRICGWIVFFVFPFWFLPVDLIIFTVGRPTCLWPWIEDIKSINVDCFCFKCTLCLIGLDFFVWVGGVTLEVSWRIWVCRGLLGIGHVICFVCLDLPVNCFCCVSFICLPPGAFLGKSWNLPPGASLGKSWNLPPTRICDFVLYLIWL